MSRKILIAACLAALATAGCQPSGTADAPGGSTTAASDAAPADVMPVDTPSPRADADAPALDMPAMAGTFEGTLPCADCPGIDTTLVLAPDGTFQLTDAYQERDASNTTEGTWSVEADNRRIRLDPGNKDDVDRLFAIESASRIVMLGADGEPAASGLDYSLERRSP
ncbi:copper resistance protein NlpE [Lysobacter sp. GX 14042]|uniref:copper resistance protein NlpE n=1 Tax=Lysobacter sp. GX 14042 TaxID=2907155 RepID=UPI001F364658|nr:copper resistance protein NlpE [Lysobacter sp. GX 14042]MCE7031617.1 copper resistance protein NlpE [Lysobacter sp. GX 14042]